ncbi:MAG: SDR family oxidoreductase [Gammaproteobacteria bacterium]|nr:SDR family oxidoreductase [Gammaproteobacteria bacterium]MCW8986445.1 SDR family oxidoreductase [Gammaproteobacteria bacterium]MCW9030422.1 SDR family oxidoreductase [Gammaproteobacteria bacterium]
MSNILILGATSAIAKHTTRLFAADEHNLYLVARNKNKLSSMKQDMLVRGAKEVNYESIDLADEKQHEELIKRATEVMGSIDTVLIAYGTLGKQKKSEKNYANTLKELQINCLSVISILTIIANQFEQQGSGSIAVISSPSGDRGRQSNYIYGTAKGALTIFLQGLRNRLAKSKVHVLTIKPGFVDTPMTKDFKKGLLWVSPEVISKGIYKAINKKREVAYLPFFWRYIMLIIKAIPEKIFKHLSL